MEYRPVQQKRDVPSNWESVNPTPLDGQICIEKDPESSRVKIKVGDGDTPWLDLEYTVDAIISADKFTELENAIVQINTNKDNITEIRDTDLVAIYSTISDINALLQSDDSDLDELQEIVDFVKQNKEDLSTLSISNIAGLSDALDQHSTDIGGINDTLADHNTRINSNDTDISNISDTLDNHNTRINDNDNDISNINNTLNDHGSDINRNWNRITSIDYNAQGRKYISTGSPSGGSNGDLFYKI